MQNHGLTSNPLNQNHHFNKMLVAHRHVKVWEVLVYILPLQDSLRAPWAISSGASGALTPCGIPQHLCHPHCCSKPPMAPHFRIKSGCLSLAQQILQLAPS